MNLNRLPFHSPLEQYQEQSEQLFEAYKSGDSAAIQLFKQHHPQFLDPKIPWLSKNPSDAEVQSAALALPDAQLALARWYDFQNWTALAEYADEVTRQNSRVFDFEAAVEAP